MITKNQIIRCLFLIVLLSCDLNKDKTKVLIFSGSNNHDWEQTTPFIEDIFLKSGVFETEVTNKPDSLKIDRLNKFDVIVSNWNSWPENNVRWPAELENALIDFIEEGGGFVTFHASTSAFYTWPDFKNISVAAWIDSTWHGKNSETQVFITNKLHPVTKGIDDFLIFDELWINAAENENFEVLATATNFDIANKGIKNQPAVFIGHFGKGRIFHTILGHDTLSMNNPFFQKLLVRGTEWAANGKLK